MYIYITGVNQGGLQPPTKNTILDKPQKKGTDILKIYIYTFYILMCIIVLCFKTPGKNAPPP